MTPPPSCGDPGAYVHLPFCRRRCSYCDFAIAVGRDDQVERYLAALEHEIATFQHELGERIETIYFGGGTPSLIEPEAIGSLVAALRARSTIAPVEVTLEANPDDLSQQRIEDWAASPVNRLSIGVQSFFEEDLKLMNRAHSAEESI